MFHEVFTANVNISGAPPHSGSNLNSIFVNKYLNSGTLDDYSGTLS